MTWLAAGCWYRETPSIFGGENHGCPVDVPRDRVAVPDAGAGCGAGAGCCQKLLNRASACAPKSV